MSIDEIQTLLGDIVKNEFTKRNSSLHIDIEKALSRLAVSGLASSGVAVTTITDLCNKDLSKRIDFIYGNLKRIIEAKNISYDLELHKKVKELVIELSKTAEYECLRANSEVTERINRGSVESSTKTIDQNYQLKLQEVLYDLGIYFHELKNKTTFTFKGWLKQHSTTLILALLSAIITALVGLLLR